MEQKSFNKLEQIINNPTILSLLESIGDGISIQDTDFKILYQNEKAKVTIGEHTGRYCYEMYEIREGVCEECPLALSFKDGKVHTVERTHPSRTLTVEITTSPILDDEQNIIGGIEVVRDITERKKFEDILRNTTQGVSAVTGDTFFHSLVTYLAMAAGTDYACIGELPKEKPRALKILSIYASGKISDNFEHPLEGTPCGHVVGKSLCCYESGVQQMFPNDTMLKDMGIESYIGILLYDSKDLPIGIMSIMDKKPLTNSKFAESMLRIFAVRAASEIERNHAEKALIQERDKAQKYLDVAGVILVALNLHGNVDLINKRGCEILGYSEDEIKGKNWFDNFLPENIRGETKNVFEKLVAGKVDLFRYFENPLLTKRGEERMIAWHNTILTNDKGAITGTLSSGEDVSLRKKIENDLKERIQELEQFYEMAIGRELRMKELKDEIIRLKDELKKKL